MSADKYSSLTQENNNNKEFTPEMKKWINSSEYEFNKYFTAIGRQIVFNIIENNSFDFKIDFKFAANTHSCSFILYKIWNNNSDSKLHDNNDNELVKLFCNSLKAQ